MTCPRLFFTPYLVLQRQCQQIDDYCGDGEEHAVQAVEDTSVAGEYVSRILDAQVTLYHRLCEVAKGAKDHDHECHADPLPHVHEGEEMLYDKGAGHGS